MSWVRKMKDKAIVKARGHMAQAKADRAYYKEIEDKAYKTERKRTLTKQAKERARSRANSGGFGGFLDSMAGADAALSGSKKKPKRKSLREMI